MVLCMQSNFEFWRPLAISIFKDGVCTLNALQRGLRSPWHGSSVNLKATGNQHINTWTSTPRPCGWQCFLRRPLAIASMGICASLSVNSFRLTAHAHVWSSFTVFACMHVCWKWLWDGLGIKQNYIVTQLINTRYPETPRTEYWYLWSESYCQDSQNPSSMFSLPCMKHSRVIFSIAYLWLWSGDTVPHSHPWLPYTKRASDPTAWCTGEQRFMLPCWLHNKANILCIRNHNFRWLFECYGQLYHWTDARWNQLDTILGHFVLVVFHIWSCYLLDLFFLRLRDPCCQRIA